jgi:xeroderma pigmentosum group C-complementing protein
MLPDGCAYIPFNGAWKAAQQLGIDYANACVRFAFHGGMAIPDIQGIVVCEDKRNAVLNSYYKMAEEEEHNKEELQEKESRSKKNKKAREANVAQRLQEDYAMPEEQYDPKTIHSAFHPTAHQELDNDDLFE